MSINSLIESVSHDINNPVYNFEIAKEYERINQTASAVSFYLRAAEYGVNDPAVKEIVYASLLRMSICFDDQKDRNWTVSNSLLQAMAFLPSRPEAYFLYSRFHERAGNWQECYTFACLGQQFVVQDIPLPVDVDYPGAYALAFERATAAWWVGRADEAKEIFLEILNDPDIREPYISASHYNLSKI